MKSRRREALALAASLLVLALALSFLTRLLTPKQHDFGSTWGHYRAEENDSLDLLFFGSSLVYCDVVPAVIWEETGLAGYVMAGPEQTLPMTYYYVREALETQSPRAVFVEITGVFYSRYTNYTKTNIGQMPWGRNRLEATFREAEPENRAGLLFPLFFYHDRWSALTADDWAVTFSGYEPDPLAGYTYLGTYCRTDGVYERAIADDPENYRRNLDALERIYAFCLGRGVQVVFYVAPTLGRIPADAMDGLQDTIARAMPDALLLDCNSRFAEIGADETRDFHDTLHYNAAGAEKFSRYLAGWISETLALEPLERDAALWQGRLEHFNALAAQPLTPLESG